MNAITIIGNLTRDPELSETNSGVPVCKFTVAVNRTQGEGADFFNVVAWHGAAQNCAKYLRKGRKVAVRGSIQFRTYEDRDGVKRTAADVMSQEVEFLSPSDKPIAEPTPQSRPQKKTKLEQVEIDDGDLPF